MGRDPPAHDHPKVSVLMSELSEKVSESDKKVSEFCMSSDKASRRYARCAWVLEHWCSNTRAPAVRPRTALARWRASARGLAGEATGWATPQSPSPKYARCARVPARLCDRCWNTHPWGGQRDAAVTLPFAKYRGIQMGGVASEPSPLAHARQRASALCRECVNTLRADYRSPRRPRSGGASSVSLHSNHRPSTYRSSVARCCLAQSNRSLCH